MTYRPEAGDVCMVLRNSEPLFANGYQNQIRVSIIQFTLLRTYDAATAERDFVLLCFI